MHSVPQRSARKPRWFLPDLPRCVIKTDRKRCEGTAGSSTVGTPDAGDKGRAARGGNGRTIPKSGCSDGRTPRPRATRTVELADWLASSGGAAAPPSRLKGREPSGTAIETVAKAKPEPRRRTSPGAKEKAARTPPRPRRRAGQRQPGGPRRRRPCPPARQPKPSGGSRSPTKRTRDESRAPATATRWCPTSRDIGSIPTLTKEQEVMLAKGIEAADPDREGGHPERSPTPPQESVRIWRGLQRPTTASRARCASPSAAARPRARTAVLARRRGPRQDRTPWLRRARGELVAGGAARWTDAVDKHRPPDRPASSREGRPLHAALRPHPQATCSELRASELDAARRQLDTHARLAAPHPRTSAAAPRAAGRGGPCGAASLRAGPGAATWASRHQELPEPASTGSRTPGIELDGGEEHLRSAQPEAGGRYREGLPQHGHPVPGPDPGGEPRADPRRREVRLPSAATSSRPTPCGGSVRR